MSHRPWRKGRTKKGRYLSYKHLVINDKGKFDLAQIKVAIASALFGQEGLSDVDKENLRKNLMELAWLSAMITLGLTLKGFSDEDDDDKLGSTVIALINQTSRIERDILFYASPYSFNDVLKSPVPAMKTIIDLVDLGSLLQFG